VEQAPRRETMTQGEIDALMRHIEKGESLAGPEVFGSAEAARRLCDNYRQLQYAIKRCAIGGVANVSPDDLPQRLAQVHYYAHRNWYLKRGFASGREFREFVRREMERRGMRPVKAQGGGPRKT